MNNTKKQKSILENCLVVSLTKSTAAVFITVFLGMQYAFALHLNVKNEADATQLEFLGKTFWDYSLKNENQILVLEIDRLPKGEIDKLLTTKTPLITKVELAKSTDQKSILHFHLAAKNVESFAYQMESPSRLLIDFYKEKVVNKPKKKAKENKKVNREPASEMPIQIEESKGKVIDVPQVENETLQGLKDGGDPNYERFSLKDYEINEEAIIASKQKVFINFPFILTKNSFIDELEANRPIYQIKEKKGKENQAARVLLTIFNNDRYASFLNALKAFKNEYPNSKYSHMLRFMEADSHYYLWEKIGEHASFVKAMALYKKLTEQYPDSPLYERTQLLMAYGQFKKKNYVAALQQLLSIKKNHPEMDFINEINISIGDSFLALNKFEDAIQSYKEVIEKSDNSYTKKKAEFKIADVYAKQRKYAQTIEHFKEVADRYPAATKEFSNVYYNLAESQFRTEQYKDAHNNYLNFLKAFPLHEHGGYALHRIGEILDILTLNQKKIKGAFLENSFRFQATPGAFLSKMRVKMYRAEGMKDKEIEQILKETDQFLDNNYDIREIDHYITAYLEEALYQRGDLEKSWDLMQSYYKTHVNSPNIPFYRARIARNLSQQIENHLEKGDHIEALRIYGKNKDVWLKDQDRLDLKYSLGKTFEQTAAYDMAVKVYEGLLNKLYALEGTKLGKKKEILESLPTKEAVLLRLATTKYQNKNYKEASRYLEQIKEDKNLSQSYRYEKSALAADLYIQEGRYEKAEKHLNFLVKSWRTLPQKVAKPYMSLADVYERKGDMESAHKIYDRLIFHYKDGQSISKKTYVEVLEKKAQALLASNDNKKAITVLEDLMKAGQTKNIVNSRYKLGMLYYDQGDFDKAKESWEPLKEVEEGNVWHQLAQDKLKEAKWKESYDKYIDRLPAGKVKE